MSKSENNCYFNHIWISMVRGRIAGMQEDSQIKMYTRNNPVGLQMNHNFYGSGNLYKKKDLGWHFILYVSL